VLSLPFIRSKTIHPIAKPWDYIFSQGETHWVILHLKDGRRIGGKYGTQSFASSYPAEEQIYIEELWRLDENGKFQHKIEGSKGLIISHKDFEAIEFF
jgi:hypothetical protein